MENSSHKPEVAAVQAFAGETVAIGVITGVVRNNTFSFFCLLTDKIVATNVGRPFLLFSVEN